LSHVNIWLTVVASKL